MTPVMEKHGTLGFLMRERRFIFKWTAKLFVRKLDRMGYASSGVVEYSLPPFKYIVKWRQ